MLRNRSKIPQNNRRNARKRNRRNADQSDESSWSSNDSESSQQDFSNEELFLEESSDSSFEDEDESVSPVIGRKLKTRRNRLNSKSKRSNKAINNRNRNSRSKKKSHRTSDSHTAGPSRINTNSRRSRSANSNTRTAKRKYKDRSDDSETFSEICNTSSEEIDAPLFRIKKKRLRQAIPNTSESDDSVIQPAIARRRINLLDSESSTSASDEIRSTGRARHSSRALPTWSDTSSESIELNSQETSTTESSSLSSIQNTRRFRTEYLQTSDSGSSSSLLSNSLFSVDSEVANINSILDSEASSSYNTAQSTSSNNVDNKEQISDSDSSDSDGEKCAICLKKFRGQLIGNPSNCDHNFCFPCLQKWSESSTTCPVDRSTFDSITVRGEINGPVMDKVKVENRNFGVFPPLDVDEVLLHEAINCEICGSGDDEETLLLCDLCNLGYHMACLRPPLSAIPAGAWYCPPCFDFHDPAQNVEAFRFLSGLPERARVLLPSARRPNRIRTSNNRSRPNGPLPRGRGPTRGFRSHNLSNSRFQNLSNVIESVMANLNAASTSQSRRRRKRRNRQAVSTTALQQSTTAENLETSSESKSRIIKKVNQRISNSGNNSNLIPRPRGPRDIVDMVFPSFSLFGGDDLDYFSDGPDEHDVDGEVAIMARVRNEYTARRLSNRKNIVTSLDNYHDRGAATASVEEITETPSSVNLLDTILESQTLWHSRNVEIKSKKDGSLEIKMKGEQNKKPDLTNTNHSSKEIPLFPNKGDGASGNKTYTNSNSRYSSLGNSSGGSGNSFSSSTSSFNNLNPSTRPGFSNLLGNNSSALDLSPFRGAAPIRFRMNPPRPMMRRQNYNSNSQRHPSNSSASLLNSVQSPKKSSNVGSAEEDVDLYDDIETENAENEKSQEIFASLEPPPEPPALLIGSDSSSDDENNGLVIDDNANKSNIYDPTDPNEDSDTENNGDKNSNMIPGYLRSPSYGGLSEFGPHLPLPEPPALPMELDSVKDSDEEEEAECPNMTLYSSTSINLANNVQDIPIPDAAYPQDELECIPIPTPSRDTNATKEETPVTKSDTNLYSPTDKNDSETSSLAEVEISSPKRSPRPRRENSEVRSISSRDSSRDLSDPSSGDESDRSRDYEKHTMKRSSRRRSVDKTRSRRHSSVNSASEVDSVQKDKPSKQIDLTEVDSNDEKDRVHSDDESGDSKADADEIADKYDITAVSGDIDDQDEGEKSDNEKDTVDKSPNDVASVKSANEDDKTDSEDEDKGDKATVEVDKEKAVEDTSVDTSLEAEGTDKVVEEEVNATPNDVAAPGNYLLPSEDLDPVSDVEYNDFSECQKSSSIRDKRKKRKKTRRRDSSTDNKTAAEAKELEEGEIEEEKSKRKYSSSQKKKGRSESPERSPDRRLKKKRDRKEKTTGKENKDTGAGGKSTGGAGGASREDLQWKKLSKNTKERNYRDGKAKPNDKNDKARDREIKSRKEKRKEIERYDVRKIVSDKPPRPVRDEFGRDVSINRSRSRTRSQSPSYMGRRRSKGTIRRSFSQEDRWINWSPVRNQRRSRSRTRRTRSRSRNRSRHSGDRYGNRSKNQDREREYDKREPRKRKRSVSSEIERYTPPPAELKKRRRSRDRSRKSESYAAGVIRPSGREREIPAEYYYERSRSWSRSLSYASLTPEPELYGRFSRSPSIIEPPTRIPLVSPTRDHNLMPQNPQNLTVIVPNVDLSKKKHKKKKDSKKKKKKQPSKEVFTSGDNIVVSVNFDDNQKIISAKSSKRKHDDEKSRKKKKDETRKRRKQALQVSDEVLNAKPVAVIDLNSSPCKEMSPTEVISLTDSGDEATVIIDNVIPTDRRIVSSQEDTGKSPVERRAYVMTQSGPKTPPEPPIKFVVNSTAPSRPLATNPIFEQDEIDPEDSLHYNKGPNTPPEPGNQQRRSISPSTTMYDPFEPTKSRSQSPENAQYDKDTASGVNVEERRPVIDMFSEDNDKPTGESQGSASAEKSKTQEENVKDNATATPTKSSTGAEDSAPSTNTKSPAKDSLNVESANETAQSNGVNTLVLDLSSLGDDFVPKSSIPLVKTSQGKYEFQSGKAPDKPITVVISQQSQAAKPQPQQVMVTPTRQVPTKQVEPIKQPLFPDLLPWKLPPPMSQANFSTPPPTSSSLPSVNLMTPSKSAPGLLAQNGNQDESSFEVDDSPYSPASSEGDDLFEPPPLNASTASPNKQRPSPMPAINAFKSRVDALFSSSPIKKIPPRGNVQPHVSKPVSAIKGTKKILKPPIPSKKDPGIRADEEQLKILDDVPNSAVEMMVKEKFLKKLHRQERVVEEVKVVLKPHYAKKHITKEEYKDILRKAVPKICHNKSGDINPNKIQGLVQAYVKKVRHAKKKPTMGAGAPLFPPMKTTGKAMKPQKSLWG